MHQPVRDLRRTLTNLGALLVAMLWISAKAGAQKLTLNDTYDEVLCVVYELPNDGDRAAAVASIEGIRDRFFKGTELIDAAQFDDDALRQKLVGGFVLYATPHESASLLKQCIGALPIKVDSESVSIGDVSVPIAEARLIFVGKNPYGDGAVAVYVGGNNRMVDGINQVFHGPRSYYLYRKLSLRVVGDYGSDYRIAPAGQALTQAIEDVEQFYAGLERVHPDLLAKLSPDQYMSDRRELIERLRELCESSPDGNIRQKDFASLLYKVAASFGDGHTALSWYQPPNDSPGRDLRYPDAVLEYRNGRFFVAASTHDSIESRELIAIDGAPVTHALQDILERCSGETLAWRIYDFTRRQAFMWWLSEALGSRQQLTLTVLDESSTASNVELPTLDRKTFEALEQRAQSTRWKANGNRKPLTFFDEDTACFTYRAFQLSDAEKDRIDGIFKAIKERGTQHLIVDLRGNGGGNSAMADFIFRYLYAEPLRSFSKYRVKLSPDALAAHRWFQRYQDLEGLVITQNVEERLAEKPTAFFDGKLVLLVDNGTFSSATAFAAMFRDYQVGEIIGYETGGLPTSFGDLIVMSLNHSGIPYAVSCKQFFPPHPRPGDDEHGVIPDIIADDALLERFASDPDPILSFAIERIREE